MDTTYPVRLWGGGDATLRAHANCQPTAGLQANVEAKRRGEGRPDVPSLPRRQGTPRGHVRCDGEQWDEMSALTHRSALSLPR